MILNILMRLASFSAQKAFVISILLGAVYYFVFFNSGVEIENRIVAQEAEIAQEEARARDADIALKEVEQVRTTVGALSEQFKLVSQALPSTVQMADIIRTVDQTAKASGVLIKSKEPLPASNKEYYEELPLRVVMEGTYSELTLFLYYLANYERIMKVKNFTISQPLGADGINSRRLLLNGNIISYRFLGTGSSGDATGGTR